MDKVFAERFAAAWIDAWNSHDIDRILSHYTDDFEMTSPIITRLGEDPSGTLRGKKAVGAYWKKALGLVPDLRFELLAAMAGVSSIVLYYRGVRGLAAEVFYFDANQKVSKSAAHYDVRLL